MLIPLIITSTYQPALLQLLRVNELLTAGMFLPKVGAGGSAPVDLP